MSVALIIGGKAVVPDRYWFGFDHQDCGGTPLLDQRNTTPFIHSSLSSQSLIECLYQINLPVWHVKAQSV